ncbi:alkaline phosphatase family protein [Nocardioides sp. URHA0020]|uniref:alkaline phosphatase family protein n=1 Tax=Nocardioides sp. URHA0020 TaxID=1380392 RepID=UPI00048F7A13|nr:alkaline phosphatase family protein [Nocardioides sp. URHA0020]
MSRRRPTLLSAVVAVITLTASAALLAPTAATAAVASPDATAPTTFRVATFNVLGFGHTEPGGDRKGYADGRKRMVWAARAITESAVDLVGFQEFEPPQYATFARRMPTWGMWPTAAQGTQATQNTIAWDERAWTAVVTTTYRSPYFHGKMQLRPLVQLRNNRTGQLVWVLNTHNPADVGGPAQKWRDRSEQIQAALVNDLRRRQPHVPVILTGDMNDRDKFYCPMTYLTELESASGGVHGNPPDGSCTPATPVLIDWVMGTGDIAFSGYTSRRDTLVKKASDHPLVYAAASIASQAARAANVRRVVVIDVEGLPSRYVSARRTPALAHLRKTGASTLNARGSVESRASLPNTVSILTGRTVARHGVRRNKDTGSTIRAAAGQYVSSVFDVAHDLGLTTSLYSGDPRAGLLVRSWNARHGAADPYGRDNGRRKLSAAVVSSRDSVASAAARKRLATRPSGLTFVQLSGPAQAAKESRVGSRQYLRALRAADLRVRKILRQVNRGSRTKGSTLVIVTSSTTALPASSRYHALPLLVHGPRVPHAGLYSLNRGYQDPGTRRTTYSGKQPIRTGVVANLVTSALRLPQVPRSGFDSRQTFNVFVDPTRR